MWLQLKSTIPNALPGEIHVKIKKQSSLGKLVAHLQPADDWSDDEEYDDEESESGECTAHLKPMEGEDDIAERKPEVVIKVSEAKLPLAFVGAAIEEPQITLPLSQRPWRVEDGDVSSTDQQPTRHSMLDSASDVDTFTDGSIEEEIGFEGELRARQRGRPRPRMARKDSDALSVGSLGRSTSSYDDIFQFEDDI
jgi:hypothetical protein